MPIPNPRTSIGLADDEHQSHCTATTTEAPERPGALSQAYAIRLADREELHQRVLRRLANLRRQQIAETSETMSGTTGGRTDSSIRPSDEPADKFHSIHDFSTDYQDFNDHADFNNHPDWTTANIPKTVAELRARSGFSTVLADDDKPPF